MLPSQRRVLSPPMALFKPQDFLKTHKTMVEERNASSRISIRQRQRVPPRRAGTKSGAYARIPYYPSPPYPSPHQIPPLHLHATPVSGHEPISHISCNGNMENSEANTHIYARAPALPRRRSPLDNHAPRFTFCGIADTKRRQSEATTSNILQRASLTETATRVNRAWFSGALVVSAAPLTELKMRKGSGAGQHLLAPQC